MLGDFATLGDFAMIANFAMIAKSTVHSENFNFRYACIFRYDSENHCAKQNSPPFDFDPNDFVLYNSHFVPIVILLFWLFWYFTPLVWLYKPTYDIL